MNGPAPSIRDRLKVVAIACAAWIVGVGWLLVFGWQGLFWVKVLSLASLPFGLLVCLVAFFFAPSIAARPLVWSISAAAAVGAVSIAAMYALTRSWAGVASLFVAAPASAMFYLLSRVLLKTDAGAQSSDGSKLG